MYIASTLPRSLRRCAAGALLALAIAAALSLIAHVAPAAANSHACTPEQRGCAYFQSAGNIMDVCDPAFDGDSVAVQRRDGRIIAVNYWGSLKFNGCRRWHIKGRNGRAFEYRVCLAHNAKPGGKPIRIERFFCSKFTADIY